jgi:hypothetical protein
MRKYLIIALIGLVNVSCLKKIEQVETANTSLFDEEYAGDQWFVYEDVYIFTNSNNDQIVKIDYVIPSAYAPDLRPTVIKVEGLVNSYPAQLDSAVINNSGAYEGSFEFVPDGASEYCLSLGIYINQEKKSINHFSECKSF